jgi:hypothetical protein
MVSKGSASVLGMRMHGKPPSPWVNTVLSTSGTSCAEAGGAGSSSAAAVSAGSSGMAAAHSAAKQTLRSL